MDIQVEALTSPTQPVAQGSPVVNPVEHLSIADRFNITLPTKEEDSKLATIWNYVKQQGEERPISDIVWEVINLEATIGAPKLGETRLDKLYRYVNLRVQEARIQEQLKDATNSLNIHR